MNQPAPLSLHAAAQRIATGLISAEDAEVIMAHAIEHDELHANVKRWATEQWEGHRLPGNINRQETWIDETELKRWLRETGRLG